MVSPVLPTELLHAIFDHFHRDDIMSLRNCSRVCKHWAPPSRHRLFADITLDCCTAERFLRLLKKSGPSIVPHVRKLHLHALIHLDWFLTSVPILAPHFQHIASLKITIHETNNGVRPARDISVFSNSFQNITALEVWLTCETLHEVATFISSFRFLESLVIAATGWNSEEVPVPGEDLAKIGFSVHLQRFRYTWVKSGLIRWLTQRQPLPLLSTISLDIPDVEAGESIRPYFERQGASLRHLTLISKTSRPAVLKVVDVGLVHLHDLRTLAVNVREQPVQHMLLLLPQVRSACLEEISFEAWYPPDDDDEYWSELDNLLTGPRFPSLRLVTVYISMNFHEQMKRHLRKTKSDRFLRFVDWKGDVCE